MIGYLEGELNFIDNNKIIVHTKMGVGYEVNVAKSFLNEKIAKLFICHIFKENAQDLYGFDNIEEKKLFELLITVNGVGPKSAFGLLSHLGSESIINAIVMEEASILKKAPGIGQKASEQLILSLKDKIQKENLKPTSTIKTSLGASVGTDSKNKNLAKETLNACVELGFKETQILPVIQKLLPQHHGTRPEDFIKHVLRELR